MALESGPDPDVFMQSLRAGVAGFFPLTPVQVDYGTVVGASKVNTLDHLGVAGSYEEVLASASVDPDGRVAVEYHTKQSVLVEGGVQGQRGGPDVDCHSYLLDEETVIDRRGGRERQRLRLPVVVDPHQAKDTDERWAAIYVHRHIKKIVDFLESPLDPEERIRASDLFGPDNAGALQIASSILNAIRFVRSPFEGYDSAVAPMASFNGYPMHHSFMDRVAWVALAREIELPS